MSPVKSARFIEPRREKLARWWRVNRMNIMVATPGVLLALALTWWFLLRGPGRALEHESLVSPETAVRVVLSPPRVQSYVSGLAPTATKYIKGIPKITSMQAGAIRFDWIHKMPLELAFILNQLSPDYLDVRLFVREHPNGEPLEGSGFFHEISAVRWDSDRLASQERGRFQASGQLHIPPAFRDAVRQHWPGYSPSPPPDVDGNHFLEVGINNSNGVVMELYGALSDFVVPWLDVAAQEQLLGMIADLSAFHLALDLVRDDELAASVTVECPNPAGAQPALQLFSDALAAHLSASEGFYLSGGWAVSGSTVTGDFVLSGFEAKLRRALGG